MEKENKNLMYFWLERLLLCSHRSGTGWESRPTYTFSDDEKQTAERILEELRP